MKNQPKKRITINKFSFITTSLIIGSLTLLFLNYKPINKNRFVNIEAMNAELQMNLGWDLLTEMKSVEQLYESDTLIFHKIFEELYYSNDDRSYYLDKTKLKNELPLFKNNNGTLIPPDSVMQILTEAYKKNILPLDCKNEVQDSTCLARKEMIHLLSDWRQYYCSFRFYKDQIEAIVKVLPIAREEYNYLLLYSYYLGLAKTKADEYIYLKR